MDERKRTFDQDTDVSVGQPKRVRPEEILGPCTRDPDIVVTRVLLDRSNFSKVIGKSGKTISTIRASTGASVTGTNITEEDRLVVLAGHISAVAAAFGALLQVLFPFGHGSPAAPSKVHIQQHAPALVADRVTVTLLLEHSRAGRVVGPRGSTVQSLKHRSGAAITIEKVPLDCAGVQLRKVILDGAAAAVARAHLHMHELFVGEAASTRGLPAAAAAETEGWSTPATPRPSGSYPPSPSTCSMSSERHGAASYNAGAAFLAMSDAFGRSLPTDCEDGLPPSGRYASFRGNALPEPGRDHQLLPPPMQVLPNQQYQLNQQQQRPQQQFVPCHPREAPPQQQAPPHMYHMVALAQPTSVPLFAQPGLAPDGGGWQVSQGQGQPHPQPYQIQEFPPTQAPFLANQGEQTAHARHEPPQRADQQFRQQLPTSLAPGQPPRKLQQQALPVIAKISAWAALPAEPLQPECLLSDIAESTDGPPAAETAEAAAEGEWVAPLSASALLGLGVPAREVGQLVDLQTFLLRNFGLELAVAKAPEPKGRAPFAALRGEGTLVRGESSAQNRAEEKETTLELVLAERRRANPQAAYLPIPSVCVGGLIGRGGQTLRELQAEFGVRAYVEKEDYMGQRIVSLVYVGSAVPVGSCRRTLEDFVDAVGACPKRTSQGSDAADLAHGDSEHEGEGLPSKRATAPVVVIRDVGDETVAVAVAAGARVGTHSVPAPDESVELQPAAGKGRCRGREDKEDADEAGSDDGAAAAFKRNRTDACGGQDGGVAALDARALPQTSVAAGAEALDARLNAPPTVAAAGTNHRKRDGTESAELEERASRKVLKVSRDRNAPAERASTPTGRSRASSGGASSDGEAGDDDAGERSSEEPDKAKERGAAFARGRCPSSPTLEDGSSGTPKLSDEDVRQQAIARCRERIEAMAEDILQSQIRDVRIT